jgi:opacity protein-like surface antigen
VARFRLIAVFAIVLAGAAPARAQQVFNGAFTGFIGLATGGDIRTAGITPGMSLAVFEQDGIGAEVDLAHTRSFDTELFAESGITSFMVNVFGSRMVHQRFQPYGLAGVGVMRVRACVVTCGATFSRTDWAFDAGGGLMVQFNDLWGVRGDVRYFRYFQRHTDVPLTDNGFFDMWRTSVGVTFFWPIR